MNTNDGCYTLKVVNDSQSIKMYSVHVELSSNRPNRPTL